MDNLTHPLDALRMALLPLVSTSETCAALYAEVPVSPVKSGTARRWFEAHEGQAVETAQVDRTRTSLWVPGPRTVDASRAGSVRLNGSTRDYKGLQVVHATADALIVADGWHVILYRVAGE